MPKRDTFHDRHEARRVLRELRSSLAALSLYSRVPCCALGARKLRQRKVRRSLS